MVSDTALSKVVRVHLTDNGTEFEIAGARTDDVDDVVKQILEPVFLMLNFEQ